MTPRTYAISVPGGFHMTTPESGYTSIRPSSDKKVPFAVDVRGDPFMNGEVPPLPLGQVRISLALSGAEALCHNLTLEQTLHLAAELVAAAGRAARQAAKYATPTPKPESETTP